MPISETIVTHIFSLVHTLHNHMFLTRFIVPNVYPQPWREPVIQFQSNWLAQYTCGATAQVNISCWTSWHCSKHGQQLMRPLMNLLPHSPNTTFGTVNFSHQGRSFQHSSNLISGVPKIFDKQFILKIVPGCCPPSHMVWRNGISLHCWPVCRKNNFPY